MLPLVLLIINLGTVNALHAELVTAMIAIETAKTNGYNYL